VKLAPCIIVDSREQDPLTFANLPAERGTLCSGDYSVRGLESVVVVERKSLMDLVACCGAERDRFVRELVRIRAYRFRAIVVEATLGDLEAGQWRWRSRLLPAHVLGSVASWQVKYAPFVFAGDHGAAARWTERFLFQAARAVATEYAAAVAFIQKTPSRTPRQAPGADRADAQAVGTPGLTAEPAAWAQRYPEPPPGERGTA